MTDFPRYDSPTDEETAGSLRTRYTTIQGERLRALRNALEHYPDERPVSVGMLRLPAGELRKRIDDALAAGTGIVVGTSSDDFPEGELWLWP